MLRKKKFPLTYTVQPLQASAAPLPLLYEHQWYIYVSVKCKGLKSFLRVLLIYAAICREAAKPLGSQAAKLRRFDLSDEPFR